MDADVARILQPKNILLWKDMLSAMQYSDMDVVTEFCQGTELVGCVAKTGLWPQKFQPATIGVEELKDIAVKERHLFTQQFGDGIQEQFFD